MALADAYEAGDVEVRPDITNLLYLVLDNKPKGARVETSRVEMLSVLTVQ